jgi:alkylation response protein AidB-like acyl-CoA dehydrogenase
VDFAYSEEQEEFRAGLRRFLENRAPVGDVFRVMQTERGHDPDVWKQMAGELGLPGLAIPETFGGQGFGFLELGIAFEEMGRVLLPAPYLATCVAASAILAGASEAQQRELLPGIASGETLATLALVEPGGDWDPASVALAAARAGSDFALEGEKTLVPDGHVADLAIVAARADGELALFAVRRGEGVEATPLDTLDPTRRLARLRFAGARAERLAGLAAGAPALARALDHAAIALAAEMAGGAARCLELAVAWARERQQFARPIGSFQAVKHKTAEVLLEVESAKAAAAWACWTAAEDGPERAQAAHLAKAFCADAYLRAAGENIQIHGGVGFTWEVPHHLHYRRAKVSESLFGDSVFHRARLVGELGL